MALEAHAGYRSARVKAEPTEIPLPEPRDLVPVLIGFALVVGLAGLWAQIVHPFISHDDWDFLLPPEHARAASMWQRVFWEGRLLNWVVWRGPGHLMTPVIATLVLELSFLALVIRLSWRWAPGWIGLPATVALFCSPMVTQLSFWPGTLWLALLLGAVAVGTVERCAERYRYLAAWIVVSTVLTFLAYPPMAWIVFVVMAAELIDRRFRDLALATVLFGATYVASTLLVFTFNKVAFGTFGLDYQPWRDPNKLHSIADLRENLDRCGLQLADLWATTTTPLIVGGVALLACLAVREMRVRALRWVLVAVVLLGLTSAGTIFAGALNPYRSYGAVWILALLPVLWLITERGAVRVLRGVALAALVVVAGWGLLYTHHAYDFNQHRREVFGRDEAAVLDVEQQHPGDPVVMLGNASDWANPAFGEEALYLLGKIQNDTSIHVLPCLPGNCDYASRPQVAAQIAAGKVAFYVDGATFLVPSAHWHPLGSLHDGAKANDAPDLPH